MYALFDALPVRTKAFYLTLVFTGIRTGEALGLKWEDVDFAGHELHVRRAIYRGQETTPKTSSSIRPRPMVPELQIMLCSITKPCQRTRNPRIMCSPVRAGGH